MKKQALNQKIIIKFSRQTKDHVRKLIFICYAHLLYGIQIEDTIMKRGVESICSVDMHIAHARHRKK